MNTTLSSPTSPSSQVLALLDDAAAGAVAIELSSTLARALQRDLALVYVESSRAIGAAALPFSQALAHPGSHWTPLSPRDVEQGFRAEAARLRELAARIALRHEVSWSLRVMRGSLSKAAVDLQAESDLLLLAATPLPMSPRTATPHHARRRPVVAVACEDGEPGERALAVARSLAQALGGVVETVRTNAPASANARLAAPVRSDVWVLPRERLDAGMLALLRCPVVLVG